MDHVHAAPVAGRSEVRARAQRRARPPAEPARLSGCPDASASDHDRRCGGGLRARLRGELHKPVPRPPGHALQELRARGPHHAVQDPQPQELGLAPVQWSAGRVARPVPPVVPAGAGLHLHAHVVGDALCDLEPCQAVQVHGHEHVEPVEALVHELQGGAEHRVETWARLPDAGARGLHAPKAYLPAVHRLLRADEPRCTAPVEAARAAARGARRQVGPRLLPPGPWLWADEAGGRREQEAVDQQVPRGRHGDGRRGALLGGRCPWA
mmetsp:Transcript_74709/g.198496  ORF Transcript_74709/g.198496 Transcript_74709/m.198496 type:complete len:267 (-) Transcript_74709:2-802(-)